MGSVAQIGWRKHTLTRIEIVTELKRAGWRMASPAMRLAILAACAGTFYVLIDGLHFEPRCVDEFSKRRATLALRQPALFPPAAGAAVGCIREPV
jgi:hypothetical protein